MAGPSSTVTRWWGFTAGLLLCVVVIGCTSPQKRYKVLSFFFDGVPNPDAPNQTSHAKRGNSAGRPIFLHKPYAEKKCDNCHLNIQDIFARAKVRQDVCLRCHAKVQSEHEVTHGPVASGMCLMCHVPHQSNELHLLKLASPKVCVQCHDRPSLESLSSEHQDPKADCLSCHSGHGGANRKFLKPQTRPTTVPSTQRSNENGVGL